MLVRLEYVPGSQPASFEESFFRRLLVLPVAHRDAASPYMQLARLIETCERAIFRNDASGK